MVARVTASRGVPCADPAPVEMTMLQARSQVYSRAVHLVAQGGERFMPPRSTLGIPLTPFCWHSVSIPAIMRPEQARRITVLSL